MCTKINRGNYISIKEFMKRVNKDFKEKLDKRFEDKKYFDEKLTAEKVLNRLLEVIKHVK